MNPGWTSETIFGARPPLMLAVWSQMSLLPWLLTLMLTYPSLAVDLDANLPLLIATLIQSVLMGPPPLSPVASKDMEEISDPLFFPFTHSSTAINSKFTEHRAGKNLERSSGPAHWCLRMRKWVQDVMAGCRLGWGGHGKTLRELKDGLGCWTL